jgi:signal transduction histidine kinase
MGLENGKTIEWTNWIQHELKTPISRMESLVQSLERQDDLGFESRKIILRLKGSLDESKSILDSLFLFNKIESERIRPHFTVKDINKIVMGAVQDSESLAKAKGILISIETEPLFPIPVDEQLFRRAFLNILENAIKFSPPEKKILLSTEEIDDHIVVQIADQGFGMSEEVAGRIFDPYYRSESTSRLPGTGLGLYISKRFIEFHSGSIELDSEVDGGTTFTIKIPKLQNDLQMELK